MIAQLFFDMGSEGSTHIGTTDPAAETSQRLPNARMRLRTRIGICTFEDISAVHIRTVYSYGEAIE